MEQIITRINVDLYNPTSYEVIKAQQGDTNRYVELALKNDGVTYNIPDDVFIHIEGTRGNSSSFIITDGILKTNNVIQFNIAEICTQSGVAHCKAVFEQSVNGETEIISTIPFYISTQPNGFNIQAEVDSTAFEKVVAQVQLLEKNAKLNEVVSASKPTDQEEGMFWLEIYN